MGEKLRKGLIAKGIGGIIGHPAQGDGKREIQENRAEDIKRISTKWLSNRSCEITRGNLHQKIRTATAF
jgi:hypothetical protein